MTLITKYADLAGGKSKVLVCVAGRAIFYADIFKFWKKFTIFLTNMRSSGCSTYTYNMIMKPIEFSSNTQPTNFKNKRIFK